MSPHDALKTLGLNPAATPEEIRLAYRDLVKVWHPDRFGADARLRAKAEEHLKSINAAYHALESSDFRTDAPMSAPQTETAWQPESIPRRKASRYHLLRGWLYVASILLIVAMASFALRALGSRESASAAPAAQPLSAADELPSAKVSRRTSSPTVTAASGTPEFKILSLSQADTDRVQLACASYTPRSESYNRCIKAQLDALRQSRGPADLTGLSTGERQAAESACSTADGASDYNHCLRQQVAAVASEPIRPDLSTFSTADRNSISAACSAASKRGAAEYDRCLVRFAKTLSDAQPSGEAH